MAKAMKHDLDILEGKDSSDILDPAPAAGSKAKKDKTPASVNEFEKGMSIGIEEETARLDEVTTDDRLRKLMQGVLKYKVSNDHWHRLSHFQRTVMLGVLATCQEALGEQDEKGARHSVAKFLGVTL